MTNEVRVGNWVFADGVKVRVTPIMIAVSEGLGEICLKLTPIPLTPEILEKAGFRENAVGILAIEANDMATHLELTQVDEKYFPSIDQLQDIGTPQNVALNYIKHLHQLQNLYFALTGEELQIEL